MARTPHIRHLRHRHFDRIRYSKFLKAWLAEQATRLELTEDEVFALLIGGSAAAVEAMPDPEPDPE